MTARVFDFATARDRKAGLSEPWLRKAELAAHFGISTKTVERWDADGHPRRKVSARLVLYRISDSEDWLAERITRSV